MKTVILFVIVCCIAFYIVHLHNEIDAQKRMLGWYRDKFRSHAGFSSPFGNYHVFTNDGGEHWYNVDENGMIAGRADPSLIEHLEAWDAIMKQVEKEGPLNLRSSQDVELLEAAGFLSISDIRR